MLNMKRPEFWDGPDQTLSRLSCDKSVTPAVRSAALCGNSGGTMKFCSKFSALGAVLVLTTTFASADIIQRGSYAQNGSNGGLPNPALAEVAPPAYAFANGTPNQFVPPPINGQTQFLQVSNTNTWNLALGNSTWVSYAQTGPES